MHLSSSSRFALLKKERVRVNTVQISPQVWVSGTEVLLFEG